MSRIIGSTKECENDVRQKRRREEKLGKIVIILRK
jgi:hypothetical protein